MSEWISVEDKLPDHNDRVVAFNKPEYGCPFFHVAQFVDNENHIEHLKKLEKQINRKINISRFNFIIECHEGSFLLDVTHWMPLPAPPESE